MCCIAEIAITVWGIVTLAKGKFTLSTNKVVTGAPAYIIGAILTATLPITLGTGFVIGMSIALTTGKQATIQEMQQYAFIDIAVVAIVLILAFVIGSLNAQPPESIGYKPGQPFGNAPTSFPPVDPNNPYQSPHSESRNPFRELPPGGERE